MAGPVNVNFTLLRVNQPTQLCAIVTILNHFFLQISKIIGARTQFNHKIRTQRRKSFLFFGRQRIPTLIAYPRQIR